MIHKFDDSQCYALTGDQMNKLNAVMKRLYSVSDQPFKLDESRDMANLMYAILNGIVPLDGD